MGKKRVLLVELAHLPLGDREGYHEKGYLIGADQKIPYRLVKTTFLGDVTASLRLGIKG